jgi:glycosyltransferase involved in cell wall biosynthesis
MRTPLNIGDNTDLFARLRVAIVHYWFLNRGGGERVVEAIARLFPQADIFALLAAPETMGPLREHKLFTSFMQRLPGALRHHRKLLFLYPLALEQFDLSGYDLVISSESGPAKGVLTSPGTCHICYCHSPMRYLWDLYHLYCRGAGRLTRACFVPVAHYMRMWDVLSANRVDHFVANSYNVANRIQKHYRRDATVIYPPVHTAVGYLAPSTDDYYLYVGRLTDYKRSDLAVGACTRLNRRLRVVGDGPEYARLRRIAGPTVEFVGALTDQALYDSYARCRALLFPAEEDFGIVPVEAQCFGRPVIAFDCGGARETVRGVSAGRDSDVPHPTGIFFSQQSEDSLCAAITQFERCEHQFSPPVIRQHALQFDSAVFSDKFAASVREKMQLHASSGEYSLPWTPSRTGSAGTR